MSSGFFEFPISSSACLFCKIAQNIESSYKIFEDEISISFLDIRPLFLGHSLLIPKKHFQTLSDLPQQLVARFFTNIQLLSRAVELGLRAEGSFVAINNRISQSVPHLHVHIVPRRKKDGFRGFFWPRQTYRDQHEILRIQEILRSVILQIKGANSTENLR